MAPLHPTKSSSLRDFHSRRAASYL